MEPNSERVHKMTRHWATCGKDKKYLEKKRRPCVVVTVCSTAPLIAQGIMIPPCERVLIPLKCVAYDGLRSIACLAFNARSAMPQFALPDPTTWAQGNHAQRLWPCSRAWWCSGTDRGATALLVVPRVELRVYLLLFLDDLWFAWLAHSKTERNQASPT